MKKKKKRMLVKLLTLLLLVSWTIPVRATELPIDKNRISNTYYDGGYSIMGTTNVTLAQMINYYQANETYPSFYTNTDAPNLYEFCKIYVEECNAEGVRAEVAFAQAMKETGFLRYRGDVRITQFNFAGIGATGNGNPGYSFPTVRMGIRAQVQHLKAYATSEPLRQEVVDPRYSLVNKGSAPYVEWLGKHENPTGIGWATAYGYGTSILNGYIAPMMGCSMYSTWYQGVDYSAVYNPDYYMLHNPDVATIFGESSDALLAHFIINGMAEGRQAIQYFDVNSYKQRYTDLRNVYGNDLKAYYLHYMYYGQNEHRIASGPVDHIDGVTVYHGVDYSQVYDYNYYVSKNPDVKAAFGNDDIATLAHFVNYGMSEGRIAKADFNVNIYKKRYTDLRTVYGNDMRAYYWHYIQYGQREGRSATGEVNSFTGVSVYNGIDYSAVYDYNSYLMKNPDVKAVYGDDDIAVLAHFVNYGMTEGRSAKESFDVRKYRSAYIDLQQTYGDDWRAYYEHYMHYGILEGRQA